MGHRAHTEPFTVVSDDTLTETQLLVDKTATLDNGELSFSSEEVLDIINETDFDHILTTTDDPQAP